MIGVYYPYLAGAGKWDELRYSLRSLEKYFREQEYEVWIVGDRPEWIQNVNHIPHTRDNRVYAGCTYDAVMKLTTYLNHPETPERFMRLYDDIYFLGERSVADLEVTRYLYDYEEYLRMGFKSGSIIWQDQLRRTMVTVWKWKEASSDPAFTAHPKKGRKGGEKRKKGDIYMTETHCPEVFEKGKMKKIMKWFEPGGNRLLTSTLYYNIFPFERMLCDRKTERALFYGKDGEYGMKSGETEKLLEGKYFLNHNDVGLSEELKGTIARLFPEKSRYER